MKKFFLSLILFLLVIFPGLISGQRVALVLSGGASKGGAHIGVIRALEENNIPIDYIAGTSIGAIIGVLYASGYTPDEMEKFIGLEEFQRWASGDIEDQYTYYYRKEDPNASWINLNVNFKKKISSILPTNLVSPFEIDYHFMRLLAPSNAVCKANFDSLMIPFRCVVADIDSTAALILRQGDLGSSVRGSMSIPIIFNPIIINKKLVFDGGMYNNFPCDVAIKEFHPDVIIGSRASERYDKPDPDDLISQLLTMLMEKQTDTIPFLKSVMIVPKIPKINLLDFSQTKILADSGYLATIRKIGEIRKIVHDTLSSETLKKRRDLFKNKIPPLVFDSIHTTGLTKAQESHVAQVLKHGKSTITEQELRSAYFRFVDEGFAKKIYPVATFNSKTGYYDLYLDMQKTDNFGIQFGGNFSLGTTNMAFLELTYKYLWTKALHFMINGYVGRFYTGAKIGGRIDFNSRLPWFIEANYTYNHFNYFKNVIFFFDDKTPSYIIEREYYGDIRGGVPITNKGSLVLGTTYAFTNDRYYASNTFSRNDTADQTSFNFLAPFVTFDLNGLNRKQFANAGARLKVTFSYVNGVEDMTPGSTYPNQDLVTQYHNWFRLRLIYDNYFQSLGLVKLGFYIEGTISNQPLFANYTSSLLYAPAFQPVPESQTMFLPAFRANNYAGLGVKMVLRIYKKVEYRLEGYIFQPYQQIMANPYDQTAYYGSKFSNRSFMASTSIVYNSPLGPVSFGVNYYDKESEAFSLSFNFGYIIFNRRAMP